MVFVSAEGMGGSKRATRIEACLRLSLSLSLSLSPHGHHALQTILTHLCGDYGHVSQS